MSREKRIETLRRKLKESELDAVLISKPENCFYLSGFTGSSGVLLVTLEEALLFTDFRYVTQAEQEAEGFRVIEWREPVWESFSAKIGELGVKSFGLESDFITVSQHSKIRKAVHSVRMKELSGLVEALRMVKDATETGKIRQAAAITDEALSHIVPQIKPGVRERDLAIEADYFMRKQGAEAEAFETIVASGERSALPHAKPTDKVLQEGDFVLIDLGARYQGYHSDMSRTFVLGSCTAEQKRMYETVREAQRRALESIEVGRGAAAVDAAAREIIAQAGWGEYFGHAVGHGVGLEVHEGPRIASTSKEELQAGMVFTIEPAVYLPGIGGVRIEDDVYLGEAGVEVLTKFSKELMIL